MEQVNDIVIKPKKHRKYFGFVVSLYLLYTFSNEIYYHIVNSHPFTLSILISVTVYTALAIFCLSTVILILNRILNKDPGLTINKKGIIDNSRLLAIGEINWTDITEINNNKIFFDDCIMLKVKNPQHYISKQTGLLKKILLTLENKYYGSPVNISSSGLNIKEKELFSLVHKNYLLAQVNIRTVDLQREKAVIQQEKTELLDSINYAKRIQTALLPSLETIEKLLGDCFILYRPKDIVSGDFYWVNINKEWVFFAACDCTGHGVPGALMSIVCNNILNRAVKEFGLTAPAEILDKVASLLIESIGTDGEVKDGMDASLIAFNRTTRELYWAGANNPLWIARENTVYELLEFKADKQPIGVYENRIPYTNHKIEIKKGDILYLFSDGYADQFGGPNGKKLTRKRFKELLMQQRDVTLHEQNNHLSQFHDEYKGNTDQLDDILVMGVRIEH